MYQIALNLKDAISDHVAFGLPQDSELRHLLNHHLMQMSQSGVLDNLMARWLQSHKREEEEGAFALGYDNVLFPFSILAAGVGTALIFVLLEAIRQVCEYFFTCTMAECCQIY